MAKANQTFFIPDGIRRLRLSDLPQSPELAPVLRKLSVFTFDELSGVTLRDFQRVSVNGTELFLEMGRLIERARRTDFAVPPVRNARVDVVSTRRKQAVISTVGEKERTHQNADAEVVSDETIFIPAEARGKLLSSIPLSVRLQHVLEFKHYILFGDLHGRTYSEIRDYRNCGKKTIQELREIVRAVQHSHQTGIPCGRATMPGLFTERKAMARRQSE